jgi:hypothetical protein
MLPSLQEPVPRYPKCGMFLQGLGKSGKLNPSEEQEVISNINKIRPILLCPMMQKMDDQSKRIKALQERLDNLEKAKGKSK